MKKTSALLLSVCLSAASLSAYAAASLSDAEKPGYSLGLFMGNQVRTSLQNQGIDVNAQAFLKGLNDGFTNTTPALSTDEIQKSLTTLQQDAQSKLQSKVLDLAAKHGAELFGPEQTVVAGNPKGKVTLVEFSDYECPHCKAMTPVIDALIANNKELRVVYRPFPIINANSVTAATAALAAQAQGKFPELHTEMMALSAPLTEDQIRVLIRKVKMDPKKYETAIKASRIKEELKINRDLGSAIGLRGTPSFLIAKTVTTPDEKETWPKANQIFFASGEVTEASLKADIDKAGQ